MIWAALIPAVTELLDKIIPDPEARDKAKLELIKQQNSVEVQKLEASMSAILAEANSKDPWTSRARPSFLYVVYILLLASLPMGVLFAYDAETATNVTSGFKAWLEAIPEPIITLFGVGYLGYTGARSWDKMKAN